MPRPPAQHPGGPSDIKKRIDLRSRKRGGAVVAPLTNCGMRRECTGPAKSRLGRDILVNPLSSSGRLNGATSEWSDYLSISPMTMSSDPTMAGISAIRQPSHSFSVTDKLQKLELFARARNGLFASAPTR